MNRLSNTEHCVSDFMTKAETALKNANFKLTKIRLDIARLLSVQSGAISAYEIRDLLNEGDEDYKVNSIYRVLDLFLQLELVHKLYSINSFVRCDSENSSDTHKHNHRFLICKSCHDVKKEDIEECQNHSSHSFKAHEDINEVLGLCSNCS